MDDPRLVSQELVPQIGQNGPTNQKKDEFEYQTPADGGSRAWAVMLASFFCNGILFGVINSYGVLYSEFHDNLQRKQVSNAAGKAALVGSFAMGTTFLVSPVSGMLTDYIGIRKTTFLGGVLASGGMLLSSFFVDNLVILCISYGIMYGLGGALAYTPSLAVLGHYFRKYLGKVNGFVAAGSSSFTIVMPYLIEYLLKSTGIVWTLRLLALISGMIMACALLYKPIKQSKKPKKPQLKDLFNVSLLKNRKYLIWSFGIAVSLFGYFVPYVYMLKFVEENFEKGTDTKLPILCIGITSGLGRLLFGYVADLPRVNRIYLQQLSFLVIGILTMLLPLTKGNYGYLIFMTLGMGLFDGCFISLLGPIAFDICGREAATQAIGFLLGICSIPLTLGPFVAGILYEKTNSYTLPLLISGIPPVFGSIAMFLVRCIKPQNTVQNGKSSVYPEKSPLDPVHLSKEDII